MTGTNRKVVLLKGDGNKWYEQAIFIMRSGVDEDEIDFVKEAEKIINSQALHSSIAAKYEQQGAFAPITATPAPVAALPAPTQKSGAKAPPQNTRLDFKLNLALLVVGLLIAAVFVYNML